MAEGKSKFWLDIAVDDILTKYPKGKIIVSSGIAPSASYHVGHLREIMTAEALTWGIKQAGREAEHIHVVDNFDPLRKRYSFLPEKVEKDVGKPVCLIDDPFGDCHKTYADHFFAEFASYFKQLGIQPTVIKDYEDLYKPGHMTKYIELALENLDKIHQIFKRVANRDLEAGWTPIQVVGKDNRFFNADIKTWDKGAKTIGGQSYTAGFAKLNWRLDWPARWAYLGVMVEPFGIQEHGAAGGSYETGAAFCKEIFGAQPPLPTAAYAPVHLPGETKKMSSSLGNLVTPGDALAIMPPEVLRYFIIKSRPEHKLFFDPGIGLHNLIDEFDSQSDSSEFKEAWRFARAGKSKRGVSSVPFSHLVQVYQTAQGDPDQALAILNRTGYQSALKDEADIIMSEYEYVKNWLDKYAPDEVRFTVQKTLPKVDLANNQKQFLADLADVIGAAKGDLDAQLIHDSIYKLSEQHKLKPAEAFQSIYQVILGQDHGPKAGWFLASLDKNWLVKRLQLPH